MTERPTYPGLRRDGSSPPAEVATVVNNMLRGALNVAHDFAIEAGADMATLLDDRFHPYSVVLVPPGSSVTGYTLAPGVLMLSVTPGPARLESLVVLA